MDNLLKSTEKLLDNTLSNVYVNTGLKVFLGLYAALAAPNLPSMLRDLFSNTIFRIFWAFLIILIATKDSSLALMLAIAFVVTLYSINKYKLMNTNLSVSNPGELTWLPSAKGIVPSPVQVAPTNNEVPTVSISDMQPASDTEHYPEQSELLSASSPELVPGIDQKSCVKTWTNEMCIQGLEHSGVNGFDRCDKYQSF
jgi:hypothetical protein